MITIESLREAQPQTQQSIEATSFVFFDIETSGLRPDRGASITEIALLKRNGLKLHWTYDTKSDYDSEIIRLLPTINELLVSGVVIGHNVHFDLKFIAYEADRLGFRGPKILYIDTLILARKLVDQIQDYQLHSLLKRFQIETNKPLHTAIVDAEATRALFWQLVSFGSIETLEQANIRQMNWSTF